MQTIILIVLFVCHWLADFTHLSTAYMLNAKRLGKPLTPIFAHALVHTLLMTASLALLGVWGYKLAILFAFQLFSHFVIDVWKGKMNDWLPELQNPTNKWHWVLFGYDQLLHALVIVFMSWYAIN